MNDDIYRCIECHTLSRIREDKNVPLCDQCRKHVVIK